MRLGEAVRAAAVICAARAAGGEAAGGRTAGGWAGGGRTALLAVSDAGSAAVAAARVALAAAGFAAAGAAGAPCTRDADCPPSTFCAPVPADSTLVSLLLQTVGLAAPTGACAPVPEPAVQSASELARLARPLAAAAARAPAVRCRDFAAAAPVGTTLLVDARDRRENPLYRVDFAPPALAVKLVELRGRKPVGDFFRFSCDVAGDFRLQFAVALGGAPGAVVCPARVLCRLPPEEPQAAAEAGAEAGAAGAEPELLPAAPSRAAETRASPATRASPETAALPGADAEYSVPPSPTAFLGAGAEVSAPPGAEQLSPWLLAAPPPPEQLFPDFGFALPGTGDLADPTTFPQISCLPFSSTVRSERTVGIALENNIFAVRSVSFADGGGGQGVAGPGAGVRGAAAAPHSSLRTVSKYAPAAAGGVHEARELQEALRGPTLFAQCDLRDGPRELRFTVAAAVVDEATARMDVALCPVTIYCEPRPVNARGPAGSPETPGAAAAAPAAAAAAPAAVAAGVGPRCPARAFPAHGWGAGAPATVAVLAADFGAAAIAANPAEPPAARILFRVPCRRSKERVATSVYPRALGASYASRCEITFECS